LASSSTQAKEKKEKHKEKKTIEKKKNAKKGGSVPFFFRLCIWDEALLLPSPLHIPSPLSFPPSSLLLKALCYSSLGALLIFGNRVRRK
jgi:hypothetical protein